jgi:hypothetical protein
MHTMGCLTGVQTIEKQLMDEEKFETDHTEPIFFEAPGRRSSSSDRTRRSKSRVVLVATM